MNWLNRLELKIGHWAIPYILHYVAGLSVVCFILYKLDPHFFSYLWLVPELVMQGQVWRLVTYFFVPSICSIFRTPDWFNAAFYAYFLVWMGSGLEAAWGAFRLNLYCLLSFFFITIASFLFGGIFAQFIWANSLLFAFARFYPDTVIYAFYVIPVKVKWMSWGLAVWLLYDAYEYGPIFQVSLLAAVANYFLFFGRDIIAETKLRGEVQVRRQKFEAATQTDEPLHACRTCGRTEASDRYLEFRVAADGEEYCTEHLPVR